VYGRLKRFRRKLDLSSQELKACSRLAGIRGVLAFVSCIFSGYPKTLSIKLKGVKHPVSIRLHTSDAMVCAEVLLSEDYSFALELQPRVVVDAGANCGMTSIFYANKYPDALVLAIEPDPENFGALLENIQPYPNIRAVCAALWPKDGEVEVFAPYPRFVK
jgi:hypothetical protein